MNDVNWLAVHFPYSAYLHVVEKQVGCCFQNSWVQNWNNLERPYALHATNMSEVILALLVVRRDFVATDHESTNELKFNITWVFKINIIRDLPLSEQLLIGKENFRNFIRRKSAWWFGEDS